ncbi:carbon-nitrogen hydrolase family protein [Endozoicomonadaceae bacterium StTr2]
MKISLIQMDIRHGDRQANLQQLDILLKKSDDIGGIVILPELFTSGYLFNDPEEIQNLAEPFNKSPTINHLQTLAALYDCLFIAGIPEKEKAHYFNSLAVVDASGLIHSYRKMALSPVDKRYFNRGSQHTTFKYKGITFGLAICLDIWFPEIIREYVERNVDILLHPANFGGEQSLHIARARAIENDMTVVTCNRVGFEKTRDISGQYRGQSQVVSPSGDIIARLNDSEELRTISIPIHRPQRKVVIGVDLKNEIKQLKAIT